MDGRQYAGVTHARLRKAAQGAGPSAKWAQCRRWVTVGGRVMAECEPVSDAGGWTKADKFARHIAAANPAAVLAMLARIDELEGQLAAAEGAATRLAREGVAIMNRHSEMAAAVIMARSALLAAGWHEGCEAIRLIDTLMAKAKGNQP